MEATLLTPNVCDVIVVPHYRGQQRFCVSSYYQYEHITEEELNALREGSLTPVEKAELDLKLSRIQTSHAEGKVSLYSCAKQDARFVSAYSDKGNAVLVRLEDIQVIGRATWPVADMEAELKLQQEAIGRNYINLRKYW